MRTGLTRFGLCASLLYAASWGTAGCNEDVAGRCFEPDTTGPDGGPVSQVCGEAHTHWGPAEIDGAPIRQAHWCHDPGPDGCMDRCATDEILQSFENELPEVCREGLVDVRPACGPREKELLELDRCCFTVVYWSTCNPETG